MRRVSFLILILAICALPSMATTTCTVTSTADDGSSGTLRYAIEQANASTCDTIAFSLSYPATITLAQGQLELTNTSSPITINGPGPMSLAISGNNAMRVFLIDGGVTVSITGVTISLGNSNGSNSGAFGNDIGYYGGGILNGGKVIVRNITCSGNFANYGGGVYNNTGAMMTVTDSTFSANSATAIGGGFVNDGTVTVTNSTLSGNSANYAAGFYNQGAATITNSTFSDNLAGVQGGGFVNGGTATITNSTFSGNSNSPGGGGCEPACSGGGVFQISGASLALKNTIIANTPAGGNCGGTAVSRGYNLSDDGSCGSFLSATGDVNNTPAGLDPSGLQNNGGPTQTIALVQGSPAIDAIPVSPTNYCTDVAGNPVTADQRGIPRPQGPACDIGAYEYTVGPNQVYSGNIQGNLNVSSGTTWITNGSISGNVTQSGGNLITSKATIGGNLQITGGGSFSIANTAINGDLQIQNIPTGSTQNQLCGAKVNGDLQFHNNGAPVAIGTNSPSCPRNTIGNDLQINNNTGAIQVFGNIVGGNLQCQGNSMITGGDDTANSTQGQCTGF